MKILIVLAIDRFSLSLLHAVNYRLGEKISRTLKNIQIYENWGFSDSVI
jgi:hypothetical protein